MATLTAILCFEPKSRGVWPERQVYVPPAGMRGETFIDRCRPGLDKTKHWCEDKTSNRVDLILPQTGTIWIKSINMCNMILCFKNKLSNGTWPEHHITGIPESGIEHKVAMGYIDRGLNPDEYVIEDRNSNVLTHIVPGCSVVWVKRSSGVKVICQYLQKKGSLWPEKVVEIPPDGMLATTLCNKLGISPNGHRVEDRSTAVMTKIMRTDRTIWVKPANRILAISMYKARVNGAFPETVIENVPGGITAKKVLQLVDRNISTETHVVEDARRNILDKVNQGITTVWIKPRSGVAAATKSGSIEEVTSGATEGEDDDQSGQIKTEDLIPDAKATAQHMLSAKSSIMKTIKSESKAPTKHVFLSHCQRDAQDVVGNVALLLEAQKVDVWYDQDATDLHTEGMVKGIADCATFLLYATENYLTRPFCVLELLVALELQKTIQVVWEGDKRHGGFASFGDFCNYLGKLTGVNTKACLETEALRWERRKMKRDVIVNTLCTRFKETFDDATKGGDFRKWDESRVCEWLLSLGGVYGNYTEAFKENGIDGNMLLDLDEDTLEELGVEKKLHKRKILKSITTLKASSAS